MKNFLGFINMLILWRLRKNCRAENRFCWGDLMEEECISYSGTPPYGHFGVTANIFPGKTTIHFL